MTTGAGQRPTTALLFMTLAVSIQGGPGALAGPGDHAGRVVDYAPGVRIDWPKRRVEVDGKVVLREGMLELFACSPNTREHESVVVTAGRPLRIYEALGLIGLTPGRPVRYDEDSGRWLPPAGDAVGIDVRWNDNGRMRTVDIGAWMRDTERKRVVPPGVWIFAGSYRGDSKQFAADQEGTVVCVVDFPSALIALPELRSADNDQLWVEAATDRIPPIGTEVTLLFSAVQVVRLELEIDSKGDIQCAGKPLSRKDVAERIGQLQRKHKFTAIDIRVHPEAPSLLVGSIEEAVRKAGRMGTKVRIIRSDQNPEVDRSRSGDHSEQP